MNGRLEIDLGEYSPELGYSFGEIAGMSRSQHRSQGMGAGERKGSMKNYLITLAGDKATKDVFEGINTSWTRFPGGAAVQALVEKPSIRTCRRIPKHCSRCSPKRGL